MVTISFHLKREGAMQQEPRPFRRCDDKNATLSMFVCAVYDDVTEGNWGKTYLYIQRVYVCTVCTNNEIIVRRG